MELNEFVKETLIQITHGVKYAQDEIEGTGALNNPRMTGREDSGYYVNYKSGIRVVSEVEINVAISIQEKEGSKAGIGVVAGIFSGGAGVSSDNENSSVSNVKFTVPVALPLARPPRSE